MSMVAIKLKPNFSIASPSFTPRCDVGQLRKREYRAPCLPHAPEFCPGVPSAVRRGLHLAGAPTTLEMKREIIALTVPTDGLAAARYSGHEHAGLQRVRREIIALTVPTTWTAAGRAANHYTPCASRVPIEIRYDDWVSRATRLATLRSILSLSL